MIFENLLSETPLFDVASRKKISLGCSSNLRAIATWSIHVIRKREKLTIVAVCVASDQLASTCVASKEQHVERVRFLQELSLCDLLLPPKTDLLGSIYFILEPFAHVDMALAGGIPLKGVLGVLSLEFEGTVAAFKFDREHFTTRLTKEKLTLQIQWSPCTDGS